MREGGASEKQKTRCPQETRDPTRRRPCFLGARGHRWANTETLQGRVHLNRLIERPNQGCYCDLFLAVSSRHWASIDRGQVRHGRRRPMMAAVGDCSRNEAPRAFLPSLAGEVQIEPCRAQRRQKRALRLLSFFFLCLVKHRFRLMVVVLFRKLIVSPMPV